MGTFPEDFPIPNDEGGHGTGQYSSLNIEAGDIFVMHIFN